MDIDTNTYIEKSKAGDADAFGQLVLHYSDYLFSIVFRLINDEQYAEDLVQESFVRARQHIRKYEACQSKFTTWLFTIATRLSLDWMKKQKSWTSLDDNSTCYFDDPNLQADELENKELGVMIRNACQTLSAHQKVIFVLRDLENLEVAEVVMITGYSEKRIKDNLYVARQKVRQQLEVYLKSEV